MQKSAKNVNITFVQERKFPNAAMNLCFQYACDFHTLHTLKYTTERCPRDEDHRMPELTSLAHALFDTVRDKMIGTPSSVFKNKVFNIDCSASNGGFNIYWVTAGSFTAIRRSLLQIVSTLVPHRLYSKYSENMRILGMTPKRPEFNYAVNEMIKAMKAQLEVAIVGRGAIADVKLTALAKDAASKFPRQETQTDAQRPESKSIDTPDYPSVRASGLTAFVVADYIDLEMKGSSLFIDRDHIYVINKSFATKRAGLKNKDRIDRFIRTKYSKVPDDIFHSTMAYTAIIRGFSCGVIKQIIRNRPSNRDIPTMRYGAL